MLGIRRSIHHEEGDTEVVLDADVFREAIDQCTLSSHNLVQIAMESRALYQVLCGVSEISLYTALARWKPTGRARLVCLRCQEQPRSRRSEGVKKLVLT